MSSSDKLAQPAATLDVTRLRLSALIDFGQGLAAEHDAQRLLEMAARTARDTIGAANAVLGMLDDHGQLVIQCTIGGPASKQLSNTSQRSVGAGVLQTMLAERCALRMHNPGGDPQVLGLPADQAPIYSFLGVPIGTHTRVYGWLGLHNKLDADGFSAEDERLARALAAQVAVAYENALRYEEIRRYAGELERRVDERTAELRRSNADLEQFAYMAAHDLQEPLRKVIGYTELLAKRYQGRLDADADQFIAYAADGARRMRTLIQDLLTYSRVTMRPRQLAPADCADVLRQVLQHLESAIEEQDAAITYGSLPLVQADRGQLVMLFQNLIGNALKFRGEAPPRVHISAARSDAAHRPEWVFTVRDNGIGIAPHYADRIFGIFQRLHSHAQYPGTGIGLALCKKIVEQYGGRVWVESQVQQGAAFYFTLPASDSSIPRELL
jgi:signal transduction histidine kinase